MLFISCFVFFISELKNTVSTYPPPVVPVEGKTKVAINLPSIKRETQCPASYSRSRLFVSTVDGILTCLNAKNGKWLWSFDLNEPLLSSTIGSFQTGVGVDWSKSRIVPSLDGTLFVWNGKHVESLALSTDFLLGKMKKLPDGSFVVGGTNVAIYGIDIDTGKVLYQSSGRGCKPTRKGKIDNKDIISLRRSQHVVRAVNRANGNENWNYSVGKFEMELVEDELELNINTLCDEELLDIHFAIQDGIITNTGTTSWSFKVASPITDAWLLENKSLKPIDIFKYGLFHNVEGFSDGDYMYYDYMYLGVHQGQMYIQKAADQLRQNTRHSYEKPDQLQIDVSQWRPFISTSSSRTPTLNNKRLNNKQLTSLSTLSTLDYPFDNGFVLISNITPTAMSIMPHEDVNDESEGFCDIYGENCKFINNIPLIESITLRERWKEILALSILIAVGINLGVKFLNKKCKEAGREKISTGSNGFDSTISAVTCLDGSVGTISAGYDSRYIDDFEHLECLGKGGFGVVFKAKKKIDDCEYAIKRIFLPHCDEAKSKMMREVKALAALDHPGIVRYFHAWWEEPPQDWQKTTDQHYLMKDYLNSTSIALSQDWVLEVDGFSESQSQPKSSVSIPEKRKSDDPLGKRFNFDTGIEAMISDHKEFDLLKHNDVFYPDDYESDIISNGNIDNEQNEDSFDIVFESSNVSDNPTQSFIHVSHGVTCDDDTKQSYEIDILNNTDDSTDLGKHSSRKQRGKKRLVGKCCAQNSLCLTQPPLFLYIQMQLCKPETLKDWLVKKVNGMHLAESMGIFMQLVDAVEYFHNLGLMHRDLKPANILFSLDDSVKVGDFGLVTAITRPSIGKHQGYSLEDENHTGQVGTQLYMSPEQALGKPYCHKVDIFSLGLIFFELVSSFSTQMERMQVIYKLKKGFMPEELLDTPQGMLIQILTAENPDLRPEAREIKNHDLIAEINSNLKPIEL